MTQAALDALDVHELRELADYYVMAGRGVAFEVWSKLDED